jgi:hypothetical protein
MFGAPKLEIFSRVGTRMERKVPPKTFQEGNGEVPFVPSDFLTPKILFKLYNFTYFAMHFWDILVMSFYTMIMHGW